MMKNPRNVYGPFLGSKRIDAGLSQAEVSNRLREAGAALDRSAVNRVESQKRVLTAIELHAFIDALNLTFDDLPVFVVATGR